MTLPPRTKFLKQFENPELRFAIVDRVTNRDINEVRSIYDPGNPKPWLRDPDPAIREANLRARRKVAYHWQKPSQRGRLNQHTWNAPALQGHLRGGGGYAVICNFGNLVCLDLDDWERAVELGAKLDLLPETLTVKTGRSNGKGRHYYFYCPDLKQRYIFNDPERTKLDKSGKEKPAQIGSLQAGWSYVIGPGSIHPSDRLYEVIIDVPIAIITADQFWQAMGTLQRKTDEKSIEIPEITKHTRIKRNKTVEQTDYKNISSCIPIEKVLGLWTDETGQKLDIESQDGSVIIASHPFHGSDSGHNFHLNADRKVWKCFRDASGGSGLELYAVYRGFLKCDECRPGCLHGSLFWEVVESALEDGFEIDQRILDRYRPRSEEVDLIGNKIIVDELPEKLPDSRVIHVDAAPREGKSHWAVVQLMKSGSGTYLSSNYKIVEHALKIARENMEPNTEIVLVEGKNRPGMCRKKNADCENCKLKPNEVKHKDNKDQMGHLQLKEIANRLRHKHKILTREEVPQEVCPYYCLRWAAEESSFVFSVVHNIDKVYMNKRDLLVLDEDQTAAYLFAEPVPIATRLKTRKRNDRSNILNDVISEAQKITETIMSEKRRSHEAKILLSVLDKITKIHDITLHMQDGNLDPDQAEIQINEILLDNYQPVADEEILAVLRYLSGYYHPVGTSEDTIGLDRIIKSLLSLMPEKPSHWVRSTSGVQTLFIIADPRRPLIDPTWISSGKRIILIGAVMSELLGHELDENAVSLCVPSFKYSKNFVVIKVWHDDLKNKKNVAGRQRVKLAEIVARVNGSPDEYVGRPVLISVGSEHGQRQIAKLLGDKSHCSRNGGEFSHLQIFKTGLANIIYANSRASRGLDLEYSLLAMYGSNFAVPGWSALACTGDERAQTMINNIMAAEAINIALRISPNKRNSRRNKQPKLILIPAVDAWKIEKYLSERMVDHPDNLLPYTSECIEKTIIDSNICGKVVCTDDLKPNPLDLRVENSLENAVADDTLLYEIRQRLEENRGADDRDLSAKYLQESTERILRLLIALKDRAKCRGKIRCAPKKRAKSISELNQLFQPTIKYSVLKRALKILYHNGKIKMTRGPRSHKYYVE